MDSFIEQGVQKHNRTFDEVLYYLSWPVMIIAAIMAVMDLNIVLMNFSQVGVMGIVETLVIAGIAVLIFLFHDRLRTEYEYTFTNGDLDFAQIFNNKKRKNLGSLRVRGVEAFGRVNGQAFQRYLSMKDVKTNRWFLNRGAELYYFYFQKDSVKKLIIFEPNDELVAAIRHYLPAGALQQ